MKYGKFINLGKRALFLVLSIYFILFTYVRTALAASFWPSAISIEADGGILMEVLMKKLPSPMMTSTMWKQEAVPLVLMKVMFLRSVTVCTP